MSSEHSIIVVDDDLEDQLILSEYFIHVGIVGEVKFFINGQLATKYLEQISDREPLPRLIVLDLNMPILNGTQTLLRIKRNAKLKDIPVIIFSTSENENEKRKCLSFGAVDYLVKPITYDDGLRMVETFVSYVR
jgi:CheY-like chemotaxis protein